MTTPRTLADWLAHCERLHPKSIDMTLDRVRLLRDRLGLAFKVPVITVAGTSSGRSGSRPSTVRMAPVGSGPDPPASIASTKRRCWTSCMSARRFLISPSFPT